MTTTLADVPTFDFTLAGQWWSLPALHVADSTGSATDEQELDPAGGAVLRRSYRTEFDPDAVESVDTNRGEERPIISTVRWRPFPSTNGEPQ